MAQVIRLPIKAPFRDGIIDDLPPWELPLTASPGPLEDVILPRGVATSRGAWSLTGVVNLFSAADAYRALTVGTFPGSSTLKLIVVDAAGRLGTVDGAGAQFPNAGQMLNFLPRCWYNGEPVFCCQDGVSSIRRFAGVEAPDTVSASKWNFTNGSNQITRYDGADDLNTQAPAYTFLGAAVNLTGSPAGPTWRMEHIQSPTEGTLS